MGFSTQLRLTQPPSGRCTSQMNQLLRFGSDAWG